jgi:ABC-type glycerol-3-phosphate transport system substrate-binding protein
LVGFRRPVLAALFASALAAKAGAAPPLQVWVSSENDAKYYRKMADLYKAKKAPAFAAEVQAFGYTEMPDKLAVAMKTGAGTPDVVQLDEIFFSLYLRDPVPFLDLTARVKAAGLDTKILKQRLALFSHGGKTYGLPQSVSAIVLYYRQDLLEKAGLTPVDLATWDGIVAAGKKAKASGPSLLALDWKPSSSWCAWPRNAWPFSPTAAASSSPRSFRETWPTTRSSPSSAPTGTAST